MNTLGKVLIVSNLVFALATGGFLAVDFAIRTNWKNHAESCERELEIARANAAAMKKTFDELDRQAKNALRDLEAEKQNRKNDEIVRNVQMGDLSRSREEETQKSRETETALQKAHVEINRQKAEIAGLVKVIEDRNKLLLGKERENRDLRLESVTNKERAEAVSARSEELLQQLADALRKLEKLENGAGTFVSSTSSDPNRPNPPPGHVRAVVERVDPRDGLVEISVGTDHGLKKYHTLEVYRLRPQAQYLGRIRIVEVFEHKALGRLVRTALAASQPLQQGDQVASSLGTP